MSIPMFNPRAGYHPDPIRYHYRRTLLEVAVFVVIAAGVFTYLFAPTIKGNR